MSATTSPPPPPPQTYDALVPKAYEVMEVLFNYKRTVEDFKKCNGKAGNPYNFPFVSDCVATVPSSGPCKESERPVPCGDGTCRSDYVSCLRALSDAGRRSELSASLVWAFREYAASRAARGLPASPSDEALLDAAVEGGSREGRGEGGAAAVADGDDEDEGHASALTRENAAEALGGGDDAFMRALFGAPGVDDRSAGTAKAPLLPADAAKRRATAGSSDTLAGSAGDGGGRLDAWGGSLSYDVDGAKEQRVRKA